MTERDLLTDEERIILHRVQNATDLECVNSSDADRLRRIMAERKLREQKDVETLARALIAARAENKVKKGSAFLEGRIAQLGEHIAFAKIELISHFADYPDDRRGDIADSLIAYRDRMVKAIKVRRAALLRSKDDAP